MTDDKIRDLVDLLRAAVLETVVSTAEDAESEYTHHSEDFAWQCVRDKLAELLGVGGGGL